MNYINDRLNITIENTEYFEIKEFNDYVDLYVNGTEMFRIYASSRVVTNDSSTVAAYNNSTVWVYGSSRVVTNDSSRVVTNDSSTVEAYDSSTVEAYGSSTVEAYDRSTVDACDNSTVEAYNRSTVRASEFSTIYQKSINTKITTINYFGAIIKQVFKVTKKMLVYKKLEYNKIATLELVRGQIFQSENHDKCRTYQAKVIAIESIDGKEKFTVGRSQHDSGFIYKVGEVVIAEYDENIEACSTGIHFFLTREKAERY